MFRQSAPECSLYYLPRTALSVGDAVFLSLSLTRVSFIAFEVICLFNFEKILAQETAHFKQKFHFLQKCVILHFLIYFPVILRLLQAFLPDKQTHPYIHPLVYWQALAKKLCFRRKTLPYTHCLSRAIQILQLLLQN